MLIHNWILLNLFNLFSEMIVEVYNDYDYKVMYFFYLITNRAVLTA